MKRTIRVIAIVIAGGLSLAICLGLLGVNETRATPITSNPAVVAQDGFKRNPEMFLSAGLSPQESAFLDQLAEDTWRYLSSDWATANHLPWSWRSTTQPNQGNYANPAEIGLFALSWLAAYDLQRSWSPSWTETESEVDAILDQLRAWQTGSQSEKPNGPNAYANSVFYQWYWISPTPPVVGPNDADHVVPSIDNAWLAASLITIREYAEAKNHVNLANKANDILSDMGFSRWYYTDTHRFAWGGVEQPKSITQATYYSDENRIINFVARALGHLDREEFQLSLDVLNQPPGTYVDITVEKIAWDGSYFTYGSPALFIRELQMPYGTNTISPATQAQISYAQYEGYDAWGFSDCFDVQDGDYVQQGAPPAASPNPPETRPGLVAPHASALALITPLSPEAMTNLQYISDTFDCAYDTQYGFHDSVMTDPAAADYRQCSNRFSALAQEWTFLASVNSQTGFVWDYFYRDSGVKIAHADMFRDYRTYLPLIVKPLVPPLVVADFNNCTNRNNLGGLMGAAYNPPDLLTENYVYESGRGCVVRLEYDIDNWSAFWVKLEDINLTLYNQLTFDVKSAQTGVPAAMRIELKRANNTEISVINVLGFTTQWQTKSVNLADFEDNGFDPPLSSFTDMEELVFVFEYISAGPQGMVYLDNIIFTE